MQCQQCGNENQAGHDFCHQCGAQLVASGGSALAKEDSDYTFGAFVGRSKELALLQGLLRKAMAGNGQVVVLGGEPGIGKTRTAQELIIQAETLGAAVLWGRCYEGPGAPPYWPWIQILRTYIRAEDVQQLGLTIGNSAADIAEIVPELRDVISDLSSRPSLEPDQARFRLFDSIATVLARASGNQPLVLVLDDLHWADRPSLLMLEFLAQQLPNTNMLVLGTYRDTELDYQHPLTNTLGELTRYPHCLRLTLRGIDYEAVRQMVGSALEETPSERTIMELYSRSQGNPLFLTEMVRLLQQQRETTSPHSSPVSESSGLGVPQGVQDLIHRRINRLPEATSRALIMASLIGREFEIQTLFRLTADLSQAMLLELLDVAIRAGIIEESPGAIGRYQFTHALVQETLASTLSTTSRAQLHGEIGVALAECYDADPGPRAAELAYHFAMAAPIVGAEPLVSYSVMAGEHALAAYAYEDAADYFEQAREAILGQPMDDQAAAILFGLGRAQGAAGQVHQAWDNLGRAFEYYIGAGAVDRAAEVAEYPLFYVAGLHNVTYMVARALTLVPPDSREAARLLSRYGLLVNLEAGDHRRAEEALEQALVITRREGDIALEIQALTNAADIDWYHVKWQEVATKSNRAIDLARSVENIHAEVWPHFLAATACLYLGRLGEATRHATVMLKLAEQVRNRGFLSNALVLNSTIAQRIGDWQVAREFSDRGLAVASDFFWLICNRAMLEFEVGDFAAGETYLDRLLDIMRQTSPGPVGEYTVIASTISYAAQITGGIHRIEEAKQAAQRVLGAAGVAPVVALDSRIGLAVIAMLENDAGSAKEQYEALLPSRGTFIDDATSSLDRVLGLAARVMGNLDSALVHFEEARTNCREAGFRPELAWVCHDQVQTLLQVWGKEGKSDGEALQKVGAILEEGLVIARELKMFPLIEKLLALQESMPGLARRSTSESTGEFPDGLTLREVEVLRLIALGKSNQQIAADLIISVHTVIYHVRNIFSKTGAANRVEAATYAAQHHLN